MKLKKIVLSTILLLFITNIGFSQYSAKKVKSKFESYTDSLKQVQYDYIFPIWGQKVYKKGFDIPYPVGVMANAIWLKQNISITNLQLGFEKEPTDAEAGIDIPLTDVEFIQFGENINSSDSYNVRADLWVLPFLNVYGIFGYGNSRTEVNIVTPIQLQSVVEQSISTKGFGVMAAGGVGPVFITADYSWTWNKPELLDEAVRVDVLGLRLGKSFTFKSRPERNIAVWVGAMNANMSTSTVGQIALKDALPSNVWDKKDEVVANYYAWYGTLSKPEQIAADKVLTPIVEAIDSKNGEGLVKYGMNKQFLESWNGIFGAQFQLNKHWMIRTEAGLVGNRKSFLASVNYRFLL